MTKPARLYWIGGGTDEDISHILAIFGRCRPQVEDGMTKNHQRGRPRSATEGVRECITLMVVGFHAGNGGNGSKRFGIVTSESAIGIIPLWKGSCYHLSFSLQLLEAGKRTTQLYFAQEVRAHREHTDLSRLKETEPSINRAQMKRTTQLRPS